MTVLCGDCFNYIIALLYFSTRINTSVDIFHTCAEMCGVCGTSVRIQPEFNLSIARTICATATTIEIFAFLRGMSSTYRSASQEAAPGGPPALVVAAPLKPLHLGGCALKPLHLGLRLQTPAVSSLVDCNLSSFEYPSQITY